MRIFYAFVITLAAALLFLVPYTEVGDEFLTDIRTDTFANESTAPADTTASVVLVKSVYDDDIQLVTPTSNLSTDAPVAFSYNATNRELVVSGLTDNATRTLTIDYSIDALGGTGAVNTLASRFPWIMLLCAIVIAPAAIGAIFLGRA